MSKALDKLYKAALKQAEVAKNIKLGEYLSNRQLHDLGLLAREVRASALIPPHEVSEHFSNKQLSDLRLAYIGRDPVNPVVVIPRKDRKYVGLVGSHRIHAMQKVFRNSVVPSKYLLIVPEKAARAVFKSSDRLSSLFDLYMREQLPDEFPLSAYNEFIERIAGLSPVLAQALADQVAS